MIRLSSSRPRLSTPSQCSDDGPGKLPGRTSVRSTVVGEYGASSGAKTATTTKNRMSTAPTTAVGLRRSRRRTSRPRPPASSSLTATSSAVEADMLIPRPPRSSGAHPGVEDAVGEVDQQVDHDEDRGQEEHAALQDR